MTIHLAYASKDDANHIADIHMAAFADNKMLLTQFPAPEIRERLWHSVARKTLADIRDPHIAVLVIRDVDLQDSSSERSNIISYAKWSLPSSSPDNETPWEWPEGTRLDILEDLKRRLAEVERRVLGDDPSYRLTYLATYPAYERRGAGALLVQWGLDRCRREQVRAYVESTSLAEPVYTRLGFEARETISTVCKGGIYDRIVLVYRP